MGNKNEEEEAMCLLDPRFPCIKGECPNFPRALEETQRGARRAGVEVSRYIREVRSAPSGEIDEYVDLNRLILGRTGGLHQCANYHLPIETKKVQ